ncbi:MAG: PEP-CTERM sorting domain-containing protein [Planctomycetota bacterium]
MKKEYAFAAASVLVAAASSASPFTVVFDDFNTGSGGTFIDNEQSGTDTVDGVTLTIATVNPASTFESTSSGTGIDIDGDGFGASNALEVEDGEDFTISFDADGTLDQFVGFQFPGTSTVTFTNLTTNASVSTTLIEDDNAGQTTNVFDTSLAFSSGDVISITNDVDTFGTNPNDGYRFNSFTITVPEPGSLALFGLGSGLIVLRRRSA